MKKLALASVATLVAALGFYQLAGRSGDVGSINAKQADVAAAKSTGIQDAVPLAAAAPEKSLDRANHTDNKFDLAQALANHDLKCDPSISLEQNIAIHHLLARQYGGELTKDETLAAYKEFKTLSAAELDAYYRLLTPYRMAALPELLSRRGLAHTPAELEELAQKSELWSQMHIEANHLALERYGQPENALTPEQYLALNEELLKTAKYAPITAHPVPHLVSAVLGAAKSGVASHSLSKTMLSRPDTVYAASCFLVDCCCNSVFQYSGRGNDWFVWTTATIVGQTDCDYRYVFGGGNHNHWTWTTASDLILAGAGSTLARASGNTDNTLVIGKNRIDIIYLHPAGLSIETLN